MRVLYLVAATMLMQSGAAPQHSIELTLDVVTIPPPPPRVEGHERGGYRYGCGCGGTGGGHGVHVPPVNVTLLGVSPKGFGAGEEIVFELLVEHVGRAPIPIAITRDPDVAPSCRMADDDVSTTFALFSKDTAELIAIGPTLFGSLALTGTTMTLSPGERLRVRVPANGRIDRKRPLLEDPQALHVEASFSTQRRCIGIFERSQNSLQVQVSKTR